MEKLSPTAFEALHIVSVGFTRLEKIFTEYKINSEQLYILLFIDIIGKDCKIGKKFVKSIPQDYLRASVMNVFGCSATKVTNLLKKLEKAQMLGKTEGFDIKEKQFIYGDIGSRSKILYLRRNGEKKINNIAKALKAFKSNLSSDMSYAEKLLKSPASDNLGPVATALIILLQAY